MTTQEEEGRTCQFKTAVHTMYGNYGNAQRTQYDDRFYTPRASAASVSSQRSNDRFYTPRTARSQGSNRSQMSLATARSNLSSASENTYKTTRSTFSSPSHYFNRPPNPAHRHSDINRPISALDTEMDLEAASLSIQHPTSPVHRPRSAAQNSNRQSNTHQVSYPILLPFSLSLLSRFSLHLVCFHSFS